MAWSRYNRPRSNRRAIREKSSREKLAIYSG
jgi:hypothetical protein